MSKRILVVGATGMLGKPVAKALFAAGYTVRVFGRNPEKLKQHFDENFEYAVGEVTDRSTLEKALEGCQGVHVNLSGGPTPDDYDIIEHKGAMNVALSALKQGVEKLTMISGASVNEGNIWYYATNAKYNAEKAVMGSGINHTIFRPSWFMESLPLFIRGKKAFLIDEQKTPLAFVAVEDYAKIVAESYSKPESDRNIFYVMGPERISMEDALKKYCEEIHPDVTVKIMSSKIVMLMAKLTRNEELKDLSRFMKYNSETGKEMEPQKDVGIEKVFTKPSTTLNEWIKQKKNDK